MGFAGTTEELRIKDISGGFGASAVYLERGDVLCIAAKIVGGAGSNVTAGLTWIED